MRGPDRQHTQRARSLRRAMTQAESTLWRQLRNRQLAGCKFVRQEPVGRYYADFVCRDRRLIVELDGGHHAESRHDQKRDADLAALGYRIVRIWNNEVLQNIDGVVEMLLAELRR